MWDNFGDLTVVILLVFWGFLRVSGLGPHFQGNANMVIHVYNRIEYIRSI